MTRVIFTSAIFASALTLTISTIANAEYASTTQPATQPTTQPAGSDGPQMSPQMMEMMQKWMEVAAPAEQHEALAKKAGTWDYQATMWCPATEGDAPPMQATGTTESEVVLGGRFLLEHATGNDPQQPFEGMGFTGYDRIAEQFVSIWIDTMSTGVMIAKGTASDDGRTITYTAEYSDAMTGTVKTAKTVETITDDNHWTMQMFEVDEEGNETKTFEIKYTRKQ